MTKKTELPSVLEKFEEVLEEVIDLYGEPTNDISLNLTACGRFVVTIKTLERYAEEVRQSLTQGA